MTAPNPRVPPTADDISNARRSNTVAFAGPSLHPPAHVSICSAEESRGENVWLVVPNDEGVFHGVAEQGGIRCVHPVQVYLDLKDHPERSAEAAEQLRKDILRKNGHA